MDIDIRLDPEPPGIFQAIAKLKQELDINIELASPQDFLPPLPGWRDRSVFIRQQGGISFYHYDFTAPALSKLSRGYNRDLDDVRDHGKNDTIGSLLISIASIRLTAAGLDIPQVSLVSDPEIALYAHLQKDRDDAYSYYNALLNSLNSFCAALELKSKYQ